MGRMHDHTAALAIAAFVLGLVLLPMLRWVNAAWLAILGKIFEPHDASFPDEDEDDYRRLLAANDAHNQTSGCEDMSKVERLRVTPR